MCLVSMATNNGVSPVLINDWVISPKYMGFGYEYGIYGISKTLRHLAFQTLIRLYASNNEHIFSAVYTTAASIQVLAM